MLEHRLKVDLGDIEELSRQYPEASIDAREMKVTEALALLEREIVMRTPRGAGPIHLGDSIFSRTRISGVRVTGIVGTPLEHGVPVELGTKPHFPPIGPLKHWVVRKLGITGDKEATSVAYAIAWKIARHGTEGAHMFEKGFDASEGRVVRILGEIPDEIVRRVSK